MRDVRRREILDEKVTVVVGIKHGKAVGTPEALAVREIYEQAGFKYRGHSQLRRSQM